MITNLVIDTLAAYRITKFIIEDEILSELRDKAFELIDTIPNEAVRKKANYFMTCPWCVSIHAGVFVTLLRRYSPDLADILSVVLATSAVTGLLYENVG